MADDGNSVTVSQVSKDCGTPPETTLILPCPVGQTGQSTSKRTTQCDASTNYNWNMSPWTLVASTCVANYIACQSATQPAATQDVGCQSGYSGTHTQARTVTCDTTTGQWSATAWTDTQNTCVASTCTSQLVG
jgi:hypothetical protein